MVAKDKLPDRPNPRDEIADDENSSDDENANAAAERSQNGDNARTLRGLRRDVGIKWTAALLAEDHDLPDLIMALNEYLLLFWEDRSIKHPSVFPQERLNACRDLSTSFYGELFVKIHSQVEVKTVNPDPIIPGVIHHARCTGNTLWRHKSPRRDYVWLTRPANQASTHGALKHKALVRLEALFTVYDPVIGHWHRLAMVTELTPLSKGRKHVITNMPSVTGPMYRKELFTEFDSTWLHPSRRIVPIEDIICCAHLIERGKGQYLVNTHIDNLTFLSVW